MMKSLLLLMLKAYQFCVSPLLGAQKCRFYPTCSQYAIEAIQGHGACRGGLLATKRICKCHPWHPGGVDLVPESSSSTSAAGRSGCRSS